MRLTTTATVKSSFLPEVQDAADLPITRGGFMVN